MVPTVPMAADVEEYTSDPEDHRDPDRGEQDNDDCEFNDASEHLPHSEMDGMVQDPMPKSGHFSGSHDLVMLGHLPTENARAYAQDPEDSRGQLHDDEEAYDRQEQMFDHGRYKDPEVPVHCLPTQYYQERSDEGPMHPEMADATSERRSHRAHGLADSERVAADDSGGFNGPAQCATSRYQAAGHQTGANAASREYDPPPNAVKNNSKEKKRKKPPRSLARRTATQITGYPPTPATEQKGGRRVRFPPHPHLEDVYNEQQHNDGSEHIEVVDDGTRDATPEGRLRREMQSTTLPEGSRPSSTSLYDRSARHDVPQSPRLTRSAAFRAAPHPVGLQPALGKLASSSMSRQHLHSRGTSKRTNAHAVYGSTIPSSDPIDPVQALSDIASKMGRDKNKQEARDRAEREALQRELQQISHDRQVAENQCHTLQQDKQSLEAEVKKCRADLDGFRNLKRYVDTFGNDYAYLQREAKSQYQQSIQLFAEGHKRRAEQELSLQQLRNESEKTVQLRNQALEVCRQAQSELSDIAAQRSQLQQELNMKDSVLVEEKTLRLQLQAQLNAAGHDREAILRQLKSNNDAVLDKLYEVHGTLGESNYKQETTAILEKMTIAVQSLGSRPAATVEDIVAVKALVESLSERLITASNADVETAAQPSALETCIEEGLNGLKAELINQKKLAAEAAACRETIAGLTEKLKMSEERAVEHKARIAETQAKVTEANEMNETLKAKVFELEMSQATHAASSANVRGLEADMRAKTSALNNVRAELDAKKEELGILQATNASLNDEVGSLRRQLEDLSAASANFAAERAQWEKKTADAVEKKRQEMTQAVGEVNAMEKSQLKDEKKRLEKQGEKLKNAEQKIHDLESKLQAVPTDSSKMEQKLKDELTDAQERARTHAKQVETLQATVNTLQNSANYNTGEAEKCQRLESQLQKLKSEADRLGGKVKILEKQIETEKANRSSAESLTEAAGRELETSRAELESAQKQLTEAGQKVAEHNKGMERYKASCEEHRTMEEEAARKREAALQDQLQEARTELQERERKDLAFHAQVQESWNKELARQKEELAKANDKTQQAEHERDNAQAAIAELQLKLEQASNGLTERDDVRNQTHMTASSTNKESSDRVMPAQPGGSMAHEPKMSPDITPTEASDLAQPMRPRKKVDRNTRSIKEVSAIPAPQMLRPSTARPNSGEGESVTRGPVVEESQQDPVAESGMHMNSPQAGSFNPFELDRAVRTPKPTVLSDSCYQDVVPETQFDEDDPSYAAFHASRSSSRQKGPASLNHTSQYRTAPDFQIYEDVNQPDYANTQDAAQHLQDSLPPAKDPYVYEKPMPPPNSSSKLVRNHSGKSQSSRGSRGPDSSHNNRVPGDAGIPSLSSSPGVMATSQPARSTNTYNSGSGKKRRAFPHQSDVAKEPAAKMVATPKRKNEASVVAGCEEERRKRVKPSNAAPTPSRAGLRSMIQPAGAASSHASLMSELSIPRGQPRGGSQPSRMQTLAGQAARAQGAKKTSRHDQMSERFQQELNRGRR